MTALRRALILVGLTALAATPAGAGPTYNVIFHANLNQHPGYANIWGYTSPGGVDYALVGAIDGLSVVNLSDPDNPYETGFIPGVTSTWRELKTYSHYCYVVSEGGGGVQIVDLVDPEHPVLVGAYTGNGLSTCHSVEVDSVTARLYINGTNITIGGIRSMRILSLANPIAPVEVGSWTLNYVHDCYVRNDRCYAASIYDGIMYVLDVTNPASIPAPLGTAQGYPHAFTHNTWLTQDSAYVLTTDEQSGAACRVWDLATLPTLQQASAYIANGISIPHNVHVDGNIAFLSHYTLGVKILDVSDPHAITEVGAYDTWPSDDGGTYNGCWGVFPYFTGHPNLFVASDMTTGLYVLEYRGPLGTLAGTVTRAGSPGTAVVGASVRVLETGVHTTTDGSGRYSLQDGAGNVNVQFGAYGYQSTTVPATIVTSVTTMLDQTLTLLPSGSIAGVVTDANTSAPVVGAQVVILASPLVTSTDGAGAYSYNPVPAGPQTVRVTAFGYKPAEAQVVVAVGGALTVNVHLHPALAADNFETADNTWIVTGNASSGIWQRADPQPTFDGATPIQPDNDHTPAPGTLCWVTGAAAAGGPNGNDVDNGETILTSPSYVLGSTTDPHVSYWRWYAAGIVGNATRDFFTVRVSTDGSGTWTNLENTDHPTNAWIPVDIALRSFITPSNLTKFQFTARDTGAASTIEALLDDFMIYDGTDVLVTDAPLTKLSLRGLELAPCFPNPSTGAQPVTTSFQLPAGAKVLATVHDVLGRRVAVLLDGRLEAGVHGLTWDGRGADGRRTAGGVYFLSVRAGDSELSRKILRLR